MDPIDDNSSIRKTPTEINQFVRANDIELKKHKISTHLSTIIDQEGLDHDDCIISEQKFDHNALTMAEHVNAVRVPYRQAWVISVNLDIAEMSLDEWVDWNA